MPRCKCCKDKFIPKKFLQKYCMEKDECIKAFYTTFKETEKKKQRKETRKEKEALKTWMDYYQEALKAFNQYIRLRDQNLPCISCDALPGTYKLTSGHYFPQGQNKSVALDEDNAHGQCWYNCNSNKSGNLSEYYPRLIKKIGQTRFSELEQRKNQSKKYTIPELIELKVIYKDKIKELNK